MATLYQVLVLPQHLTHENAEAVQFGPRFVLEDEALQYCREEEKRDAEHRYSVRKM